MCARTNRAPVAGYRALKRNEYQLTCMACELLRRRPANLAAAGGLLALARSSFRNPASCKLSGTICTCAKAKAAGAYQAALGQSPEDEELREKPLARKK